MMPSALPRHAIAPPATRARYGDGATGFHSQPIDAAPRHGRGAANADVRGSRRTIRRLAPWIAALAAILCGLPLAAAAAKPLAVVAFGDSLTAGYLLPADRAFPAVLEAALRRDGLDVTVTNAGVSGDTSAAGLERLDWSVPDGTDGVILELGANDMLRGQDPALAEATLATIVEKLQARHIRVFLAGMLASPTLGTAYVERFDALYPALAKRYGLPLYPFFLTDVAGQPRRQLSDGMHPNAEGVDVIVAGIKPAVETWLRGFGEH